MLNLREKLKEDWKEVKLGEISQVFKGAGLSKSMLNAGGKNKCILYGELYTKYKEVIREVISRTYSNEGVLSQKDDVLLPSSTTTTGNDLAKASSLKEKNVLLGGDIIILRNKHNRFNGDFLSHYLTHKKKQEISRLTQGITIIHLYGNSLKKLEIKLPSLEIQKQIAEILSKVDEDIETTDEIIKKTEELKKGLMQELLTKGIGHKKFKKTKLGMIPEDWEIASLNEIGIFSKGRGIPKKELVASGLPAILYGQIYTKHHFVVKKINSFISKNLAMKSVSIEKGDILFTGSGETPEEIGKAVVYLGNERVYAGGDIIIFSSNNNDSLFLSYLFNNSFIRKKLMGLAQGNSVVHIYKSFLEKMEIILPGVKEQKEIAKILSKVDEKIEVYREIEKKLEILKKGLMQDLLK